jgi:quercetin dioxygenase-like cupin family protein
MRGPRLWILAVAVVLAVVVPAGEPLATGTVTEKLLLDNERMTMYEFVFPPGFRGDEHAAVADEFAYVLDGQFGVVTKGQGKRVVRAGEVEYARKGTVHYSVNESRRPARVLVVLLKER